MINYMNINEQSLELYKQLESNQITEEQYVEAFNKLGKKCESANYRRDKRSLGDYALHIYKSHKKERELVDQWRQKLLDSGTYDAIIIEDGGMDNTGCMTFDSKKINNDADFYFTGKNGNGPIPNNIRVPLEVKIDPVIKKATYKTNNLRSYIEQDAYVLTIFFKNDVAKFWTIFDKEIMENLLANFPETNRPEMGWKPCIQIKQEEYEEYFNIYEW